MKSIFFFIQNNYFSSISIFFANSMMKYEKKTHLKDTGDFNGDEKNIISLNENEQILYLTYLLVSHEHENGNLCLDIKKWVEKKIVCKSEFLILPSKEKWLSVFPSEIIGTVNIDKESEDIAYKPILFFSNKFYLQKNFIYQKIIADEILARKDFTYELVKNSSLKSIYPTLFPSFSKEKDAVKFLSAIDWQGYAAFLALVSPFVILSGGPGTGKTSTIFRILILLLVGLKQTKEESLNIQLVAPTGKAVKRLQESLLQCDHDLQEVITEINSSLSFDLKTQLDNINEKTMTVHRFLKRSFNQNMEIIRHSYQHIDVLIIDESTMISIETLAILFNVLKPNCRILFLGDKHQLASIGEGSLLGYLLQENNLENESIADANLKAYQYFLGVEKELNERLENHLQKTTTAFEWIKEQTVILKKNYRILKTKNNFTNPVLSKLYQKIISTKYHISTENNPEHYSELHSILDQSSMSSSELRDNKLFSKSDFLYCENISVDSILATIKFFFLSHYKEYFSLANQFQNLNLQEQFETHTKLFTLLKKVIVLTVTNQGEYGVDKLNLFLENLFLKETLIKLDHEKHYPGKVILITENNYRQNLYNGDIGIALYNSEGEIQFYFNNTLLEKSSQDNSPHQKDRSFLKYYPHELRKWKTGFVTTVHKSQGSEYENVISIFPEESAELCDRSLIYTALTRTTKRCIAFFKKDFFLDKISKNNNVQKEHGFYDYLEKMTD